MDTKGALQSKTIWEILIAAAPSVARMLGFDLGDVEGFATDITVLVGAVLAVYGRIKAVKKIGKPAPEKAPE